MPSLRDRRLRILQVNTVDRGGGAATVAAALRDGYARCGHSAQLVAGTVGSGTLGAADDVATGGPTPTSLPDDDRALFRATGYVALQRLLRRRAALAPGTGWGAASRVLRGLMHPGSLLDAWQGREDFAFPGTGRLLERLAVQPDILELHNLHGGYFDLRALVALSQRVPTVLALHDAWLLTGHCAHPFGCTRWETGCGVCPDLTIEPAVRRDATAENWHRKRDIYSRSRLYVATPSRWLADMVARAAVPAVEVRVIPNGVDVRRFCPGDQAAARRTLGLPAGARIVLTLPGRRVNQWRDRETLVRAVEQLGARIPGVLVLALDADPWPVPAGVEVRHLARQHDAESMARCFQAADVYLHSARADTFPTVVLEALACGTPVVATDVGGIPEQLRPIAPAAIRQSTTGATDATGILVPAGDATAMADAVEALLVHPHVARRLGANGVRDVAQRFTVDQQVEAYLAWYGSIMDHRHASSHAL